MLRDGLNIERTDWASVSFGLSLSYFAAFQLFKIPPVLPALLDRYHYDLTLAAGFMSVYAAMGLLLSIPLGRIFERFGVVPPVLVGLALMFAGNVLGCFYPQSGAVMLFARALEGMTFAGFAIIGPVIANSAASPRDAPIVIGIAAGWIPVGQLVGALVVPVAHNWQMSWWLGIAGCVALGAWTVTSARNKALAFGPALGFASKSDPMPLTAGQRVALLLGSTIFLLWGAQYFAYMTWLPEYLITVHGFSLASSLIGYVLPVVVVLLFNLTTGWILRLGVPVGGLLVAGLGVQAAVWWLVPYTAGGWSGISALAAYGVGAGVTPTSLFAVPNAVVGRGGATASAFGFMMTGRNIGVLIGPVLLALAFGMTGSWNTAVPIFGTSTTVAFIVAVMLARGLRRGLESG